MRKDIEKALKSIESNAEILKSNEWTVLLASGVDKNKTKNSITVFGKIVVRIYRKGLLFNSIPPFNFDHRCTGFVLSSCIHRIDSKARIRFLDFNNVSDGDLMDIGSSAREVNLLEFNEFTSQELEKEVNEVDHGTR